MSTKRRTPVHFPAMKVRGRRNRKKLHARLETRIVIPAGSILSQGGGLYTVKAGVPAGVATHSFMFSEWRDGFGRRVPAPRPTPDPPMRRSGTFRLGLTFATPPSPNIFDLLTGKKPA